MKRGGLALLVFVCGGFVGPVLVIGTWPLRVPSDGDIGLFWAAEVFVRDLANLLWPLWLLAIYEHQYGRVIGWLIASLGNAIFFGLFGAIIITASHWKYLEYIVVVLMYSIIIIYSTGASFKSIPLLGFWALATAFVFYLGLAFLTRRILEKS